MGVQRNFQNTAKTLYLCARFSVLVSIYQQCDQIKSTFVISHSDKMNYNCLPWTNRDENVYCCSIVKLLIAEIQTFPVCIDIFEFEIHLCDV
jgi:hypothetical protein